MSAPKDYPGICKFCGEMVTDVEDYLSNHLEKHFPVAAAQLRGSTPTAKRSEK